MEKATAKKRTKKASAPKKEAVEAASEVSSTGRTKGLVVVESPAKAKTLKKYLGRSFDVKASVGHVMDLPKSSLGVDPEKDFEPVYELIKGKQKVVEELAKAALKADKVYLAADPEIGRAHV